MGVHMRIFLIFLLVWIVDGGLNPGLADDDKDCAKGKGEVRIRACSEIIKSRRLSGKPISKRKLALIYALRGIAYRHKKQYDRAIADYDRTLKLNPRYAPAYALRGAAYLKWGKPAKGLPDANMYIQLRPNNATALGMRGHIYEALGQKDKAIADELCPKVGDGQIRRRVWLA